MVDEYYFLFYLINVLFANNLSYGFRRDIQCMSHINACDGPQCFCPSWQSYHFNRDRGREQEMKGYEPDLNPHHSYECYDTTGHSIWVNYKATAKWCIPVC